MRWLPIAVGTTGLFLISLTPSHATATTDSKIFAGASCWMNIQQAEDFAVGQPSWPASRWGGTLRNTSGESRTVYCPLVRDSVSLDTLDLEVNVDPGSSGQIECYGSASDRDGYSFYYSQTGYSHGSVRQPLDLGYLYTFSRGHESVRCTLPDGHKIVSIDLEEYS